MKAPAARRRRKPIGYSRIDEFEVAGKERFVRLSDNNAEERRGVSARDIAGAGKDYVTGSV